MRTISTKHGARLLCSALILTISATSARANITLTGNTTGNPVSWTKLPCPRHGTTSCSSELVAHDVTLIKTPTDWFKKTLEAEYSGNEWNFHYLGGNNNMNGTFDVDYYRAYNECGPGARDFLGAEIKVAFVPDPAGSLIKDVLWVQTYHETWSGHDASAVDDKNAHTSPGALGGPFYPYQDEDETAPFWQSSYQYDYLYDKPGDPCPDPGTKTTLRFETYATWWDDYFKPDGTIADIGSDGHHIYFHEGFSWGYDLVCIPEPVSLALSLLGLSGVAVLRRRKLLD